MTQTSRQRLLVILLRLAAALTLCAFFAIFLPTEWMRSIHGWLELGEFPATPITDYLTRSVSALYAFHGGLLLAISLDTGRYLPLIRYIGLATVALGLALLIIDFHAEMPLYWVLLESPPVMLWGLAVYKLASDIARVQRA